jgi:hypothetical protein
MEEGLWKKVKHLPLPSSERSGLPSSIDLFLCLGVSVGKIAVFIQTIIGSDPPSEHPGLFVSALCPGGAERARFAVREPVNFPLALKFTLQDAITTPGSAFAGNISTWHFSHDIFLLFQG